MKQGGGSECLGVAWEGPGLPRQVIQEPYLWALEPPKLPAAPWLGGLAAQCQAAVVKDF
jgi:hypothetical protein